MPPARKRPKRHGAEGGGRWPRIVKFVVQRDAGLCHLCGHFGAKSADHLIPVTERPDLALDVDNMKAAHSYPHGCPECSAAAMKRPGGKPMYCNELRGMGSIERVRRIIEERTGLKLPVGEERRSEPPKAEGRDLWLGDPGPWAVLGAYDGKMMSRHQYSTSAQKAMTPTT